MPGEPTSREPRSSRLLTALSVLSFGVGGVALVWMLRRIGVDEVRDGLAEVGWGFAAMWVSYLVSMVGSAVTLRYCAGPDGASVPVLTYLRITLAGHAINEATPLGKLGEVTKFTLLGQRMPTARAASALIIDNLVGLILGSASIASAPLVAWGWFDPDPHLQVVLIACAAVFALIAAGAFFLMWHGVGDAPFRLLRRLRVPRRRVDGWQRRWRAVAGEWYQASHHRRSMVGAFAANASARAIAVIEPWIALELLGVPHPLAAAWLASAAYMVVSWAFSFVPLQTGTAEAGAYGIFEGLGLPPGAGVLLELLRKVRRLSFIAVGVVVLGWSSFAQMVREAPDPSTPRGRGPGSAQGDR